MSPEAIRDLSQEAARKAAAEHLVPYIVWPDDLRNWKAGLGFPLPFPFIGDHEPEGYEPIGDALFVDTSGLGDPGEPALTSSQLIDRIQVGKGYALTTLGQFQGYLQTYERI